MSDPKAYFFIDADVVAGSVAEIPKETIAKIVKAFEALQRPLGRLAMAFAELEDELTTCINLLLRIDATEGAVLEALMQNFNSRIELFDALAQMHTRNSELKKLAKRIASRVREANSDRNNLLHDAWRHIDWSTKEFRKVRYKVEGGALKRLEVVYGITEPIIIATAHFVACVHNILWHWRVCFSRQDAPATWPPPLDSKYYEGSPLHTHGRGQKSKPTPEPPRSSQG